MFVLKNDYIYRIEEDETSRVEVAVGPEKRLIRHEGALVWGKFDIELGDYVLDPDNTEPIPQREVPVPAKSLDKQLVEVKENQLILMDAVATLYETMTGGTA